MGSKPLEGKFFLSEPRSMAGEILQAMDAGVYLVRPVVFSTGESGRQGLLDVRDLCGCLIFDSREEWVEVLEEVRVPRKGKA